MSGKTFNNHTGLFDKCKHCSGRGTVINSHICACGAPVTMLSTDKVLYCGRKECLTDIRADIKEDAEPSKYPYSDYEYPGPWPGHGYRWAD